MVGSGRKLLTEQAGRRWLVTTSFRGRWGRVEREQLLLNKVTIAEIGGGKNGSEEKEETCPFKAKKRGSEANDGKGKRFHFQRK